MKKLLSIFSVASLLTTSTISVIACKNQKANTRTGYFDSELNKIDPVIRNEIKYTSSIAKILIAARHENMNTYAFPALQYFLNSLTSNLQGTFTTKSGQQVKINDYVTEYKKLNNMFWRPNHGPDYYGENNRYNIMSTMVQMDDFSKWNVDNWTADSVVANPNTAWALYDTGAYANILSQHSKTITNYIQNTKDWFYYYGDPESPGVSNLVFDNAVGSPPTPNNLTYFDKNKDQETVKYGQAIANQTSSLYDLFGTQYFNLAMTGLNSFGVGAELPALYNLTKLLPVVKTDQAGEKSLGLILAAPLAVMSIFAIKDWYHLDSSEPTINSTSPLAKIFGENLINTLKVQYQDNSGHPQNVNLYNLLKQIQGEIYRYFLKPGDQQKQSLALITNQDFFIKWYAILNQWFTKALSTLGPNFNEQNFNATMSLGIYQELQQFQNSEIFKKLPLATEASGLLRIVTQMLKEPGFDLYKLLRGIGSLANWFYRWDDTTHDFVINQENVQHIEKVYNEGPTMADYQVNLGQVNPHSKYGQFVLNELGFLPSENKYHPGSFLEMLNIWAHGDQTNSDADLMHQFISETTSFDTGFLGKLVKNVNQTMANDWFDNIFLDKKWNITAEGTGVDGKKLGKIVDDNGSLVGVRYQLDYYGPKDQSVDLNHHTASIDYTEAAYAKISDWSKQYNPLWDLTKNKYNAPPVGQRWTTTDWQAYDGDGNQYLNNSEQIKYSYVVEFDNEARLIKNYPDRDNQNQNGYRLGDFAWYYNNRRYY
ncbi:lipoprotein [Spiroplasma sp. DGKH1]|uniref:lipoprotein n=1 Tax=Spiroplasma sp. DGKH1 TaxID=3050074 RepID=UPI0034C69F7D